MHSIFKRFREPIFVIALLAVPFVLFFVRAKQGRDLNLFDRAVISAIAPIEKLITIAAFGVVGIVSQLTGSYADVQLIVSPLSAVPAIAQRTRSRSTIKGTGDITRCKLSYALRTDDLQEGDILVTAGGPGFFPQGLRIGRVVNIQKKSHGLFLDAEVLPAVDFSRLDEVLVVVDGRVEPEGVASGPGAPGSKP